uniref:Uncharacterized protein n=1 Tax=Serinus canaria TaxID=9135 RepID=A0A8C9N0M5_SERCA
MGLPPARGRSMAAAEKAQRYEAFVSDVLQRDLRRVQEQRDAIFEQQAQVLQLRSALTRLQVRGGRGLIRGCGQFWGGGGASPDPRRVFVALGFGFFAELTLPEALRGEAAWPRPLATPLDTPRPHPQPPDTPHGAGQ